MSNELRFTPDELRAVAEQLVTESGSEDGKISISELTSALSRAVNREEAQKFKQITGRDSFGRLEAKKVA